MAHSLTDRVKAFFNPQNTALIPAKPAPWEMDSEGKPISSYFQRIWSGDSCSSSDRLAAVYGCVNVISSSISAMPLHLYQKKGQTRARDTDHPVARLLATRPNQAMTWPQLREAIAYNAILRGNQKSRVFWKDGYPIEVFPIPANCVDVKLSENRKLVYEVMQNEWNVPAGTYSRPDIAHFKALTDTGIEGINPIEHCRMTMGSAVALTQFGKQTAQEGGSIRGILSIDNNFKNPDQAKEVRKRWGDNIAHARENGGVMIIEGQNAKFAPINMSMVDAQYLESMQFSVEEICRIFNVPPHKIQKLDRATFNNIEHLTLEFYTSCLVPWITRFEATLNESLLTDADRIAGYFIRHNADGLLRGDMASRSEAHQKQIGSGVLTPNEARALEDRPPIAGGDQAFFPINHTTLDKIGQEPAKPTP